MRISTSINYSGDVKAAAEEASRLEAGGVDMVWVAEAYGFDAVSLMGYLTAITESVVVGSGILNIYSRTPSTLAQTAAGLDNLSGGRFALGLGASGPQVIEGFHGVPYHAPIGRTREIIEICRKIWAREAKLDHHGKYYDIPLADGEGTGLGKPLKIINHPIRSDIPIYLAALGPKNIQLTAEVANGWLPIFFHPAKSGDVWGADLETGKAKRDPALGELDVVAGSMVSIGEGAEKNREFMRPMIALYVGGMGAKGKNFYNTLFTNYGYGAEAEQIQDLYLDGKKQEAAALIPDDFLEATSLCGPEAYVKDRLAEFAEAGVTNLNVTPVPADGGDPVDLVSRVKQLAADI